MEISPQYQLPCDTSAFKCGAPKITFFGGGGAGAVGEAIVDNVGRTIGVDLVFGGSNYNRPPFVSFEDSCENTFTSGYAVIDSDKKFSKIWTSHRCCHNFWRYKSTFRWKK